MTSLRAAVIIASDAELFGYLFGLSVAGFVDLATRRRAGNPYPSLYDSGVRYTREPPGSEVWQIPRVSLSSKQADCEDLCAGWRVPELWLAGETSARPYVKRINPRLRHILVERWDGSLEDASLILGMHDRVDPGEALAARRRVLPVRHTPDDPLPRDLERFR